LQGAHLTNEIKINQLHFLLTTKINKKMAQKLYTGIIFFKDAQTPRKYRNILDLQSLSKFGKKIGAWYVNLYDKKSGKFDHRMYF
jgi:hypothetical protein